MNEARFDAWSRSLNRSLDSRRKLLRGLATASLGLSLASLAADPAEAKKKKRKKKKKPQTTCNGGTTLCGKRCLDTKSDPNNCGGCGVHCGLHEECTNSVCTPIACPANSLFCAPGTGQGCGPGACGCASAGDGSGFCSDCAFCFLSPECTSDEDCVARGMPAGTVCGDSTGGDCNFSCSRACFAPCGSCPDCSCKSP
jgi:hypothetical protein